MFVKGDVGNIVSMCFGLLCVCVFLDTCCVCVAMQVYVVLRCGLSVRGDGAYFTLYSLHFGMESM